MWFQHYFLLVYAEFQYCNHDVDQSKERFVKKNTIIIIIDDLLIYYYNNYLSIHIKLPAVIIIYLFP